MTGTTTLGPLRLPQLSNPPSPTSAQHLLYPKSDGKWYSKDSAGNETLVGPASGSFVTTDTTQTITGNKTFSGQVTVASPGLIALNDQPIQLRSFGDSNHEIRYIGWNGPDLVDGPRLKGASGGELGYGSGGAFTQVLRWSSGGILLGTKQFSAAGAFSPDYRYFFGGGASEPWKTIATCTLPGDPALYTGCAIEIRFVNAQNNWGANQAAVYNYRLMMRRSGGTLDEYNDAVVWGPVANQYVRVVKTATGSYAIDVRPSTDWQHCQVECRVYSRGSSTLTWIENPVASTATGTEYYATPESNVFGDITVNGNLYTPGVLPASTPGTGTYLALNSNIALFIQRTAGAVGVAVKGASGQTADLQQWLDSTGVVKAKITPNGALGLSGASPDVDLAMKAGDAVGIFSPRLGGAMLSVDTGSPGNPGIVVRGQPLQTGDLIQWMDSAYTVLSRVYWDGSLQIGPNHYIGVNAAAIHTAANAGSIPLIAKGVASQTGDLQQWQNSAGTLRARVDSNGSIQSGLAGDSNQIAVNTGFLTGTSMGIRPGSASRIGIIVQGESSQTGDLQQWQDSAGTAVAKIGADGAATIPTLNLTNALDQSKTHASPDTDSAPTALHHTLGTGANQAAAGNHTHTKADIGLGSVDNTSDVSKPISTATQTALDGKAPTVPPGTIQMYAGDTAPSGWLFCGSTPVSRTTYAALFAVIGTTYGAGDGSTTFNLPNFNDRFPVGAWASKPLASTGGQYTYKITTAQLPDHTHSFSATSGGPGEVYNNNTITGSASRAGPNHTHAVSGTTGAAPGGSSANGDDFIVTPPYLAINYMIKY